MISRECSTGGAILQRTAAFGVGCRFGFRRSQTQIQSWMSNSTSSASNLDRRPTAVEIVRFLCINTIGAQSIAMQKYHDATQTRQDAPFATRLPY